ncbi:MAG: flagellar hook-associated protein FlgK [bacterium]|nr:flagellar hook-associated protein FlgK [bacterium]
MSLNSIMRIGLSGMFAAGTSLQTTGHNIANASTVGYSRQRTLTGTQRGQSLTYGVLGTGTMVLDVRRMTDEFLTGRLRAQDARLSQFDTVDMALGDVEAIFGSVENNHLGTAMSEFFNAWSSLATPPVSLTLQEHVADTADRLASDFRDMSASLDELSNDLDARLENGVGRLNALLTNVAELNRLIVMTESTATSANDLRDQRSLVLDEIAQLTQSEAIERDDGTVDVLIGGRTVVTREHVQALTISREDGDGSGAGRARVTTVAGGYDVEVGEGSLQGLLEARDEQVLHARTRLDAVAAALIERVNALHAQGQTPGGSGVLFFTGDSAANIALNPALMTDPTRVAASRSGLEGDTDLAREIAALGQSGTSVVNGQSLTEMFNSLVLDLASRSAASGDRLSAQTQIVESLGTRLDSIRGVSLDEEAANLALFQNAYEANAKVIAMVQDMFDTILTMV